MSYFTVALAFAITIVAAIIEAKGYDYSFKAFRDQPQLALLGVSFLLYSAGILLDYVGLFILSKSPIFIPELLAMIFMVTTMIGIALFSGQFFTWSRIDQTVAVSVVSGLAWLTYRVD